MTRPIDIARRELAAKVHEATNANDGVPAERYSEGRKEAWCANFVRYCFEQCGHRLPGKRWLQPSVKHLEAALDSAGARITAPEPGAIVTFETRAGSDKGPGRHVEIVDVVKGTGFFSIGGNVGHRVARRYFRTGDPTVSGFFRWPREGT